MSAPGRYCLAVCYCGECSHYKPAPRPRALDVPTVPRRDSKPTEWDEREEGSSWIDKL